MTITLDNHGNSGTSGGTTTTITITAAAGTSIILGCVVGTNNTTTMPVLSITGAAGLTWTAIGSQPGGQSVFNSRYFAQGAWIAQCPAGLSAQVVTITSTIAIDNAATVYASYTGVIAPYLDPNGALPINVTTIGVVTTPQEPYTTTYAPDLLFAFIGSNQNNLDWIDPLTPPGSTVVDEQKNSGGIYWAFMGLMTIPVAAAQSAFVYGTTYATSSNWAFIGAALTTGPAPTPGVPTGQACGTNGVDFFTAMWSAGSGGTPTSYTLQYRISGATAWTTISGITATSQAITGLVTGNSYEWQVQALNAAGNSTFSGSAFCSTQGAVNTTFARGSIVVGDYQNGNLYVVNLDEPLDNGTQRKWLRTWRALQQRVVVPQRFPALIIRMQSGEQVPDGTNPQLQLRWSDDGGHTWSNTVFEAVGPTGAVAQQIKFRRLGSTRVGQGLDRIMELSSTDEFKVAIVGADWEDENG